MTISSDVQYQVTAKEAMVHSKTPWVNSRYESNERLDLSSAMWFTTGAVPEVFSASFLPLPPLVHLPDIIAIKGTLFWEGLG